MIKPITSPHGWAARLDLTYGLRATKTRLLSKQQIGPLTLQRAFYPEGDTCHSYILHPPGGVAGGDSLKINVDAQPGAHCLITTPGATKFYRSDVHRVASQSQTITVGSGAVVEWLPQQNIFFPGANVALATTVEIAPDGKYAGWEINSLGRPANAEIFSHGSMRSTTHISLAGKLRLAERLCISGERDLAALSGMRGLAMQGCFIAAPCNTALKDALEQILQAGSGREYPHPIGLTLVDEILVIRALGEQAEPLQRIFTQLWTELRHRWLHKASCVPRIWAT